MAPYRGRYLKKDSGGSQPSAPVSQQEKSPASEPVTESSPAPQAVSRQSQWKSRHTPQRRHLNSWFLLLYFWLAAAIPELLLHISTAQNSATLFNSGLPLSMLFALVPALIAFTLTMLIPWRKLNFALTIVYTAAAFILCASQLIYYRVFGCFYSAYSMANGGQVLQFWNIVVAKIWENLPLLIAMALPLLFLCIFGRRCFSFGPAKRWYFCLGPGAAAVIVQILLVLCLPFFGGTEDMSAYDLYHADSDAYYSVNKLGLGTAFRLDVARLITGNQPSGSIHLDVPPTTLPTTSTPPSGASDPSDASDPSTDDPDVSTAPTIDTSPNVLNINFEGLINRTTDKSLIEVHQYFQSRTPSSKNEHTGLFEGCNLILITAEAFDYLIVDEERTPTLYKMMHEGYYFTDYYVPDWGTSTTDGEYAFLTGTVPKTNVWSFYRTAVPGEENAMPLTMCQQLMALGYKAYAYHGHTYSYYHRDLYLQNLGYTYRAYGQGLDVKYTWPESDVEVIDQSTEDYVNNEPFTAYYMTISGHREFTFVGNYIAYKNKGLVEDEPYSTNVKAYIACQLELEASLTLLLERLEEAGVLENTVIVLTPDHYPNGLTNDEISELLGHQVESNFEIFKNGCIIYKAGMTPETIDAPCSHLDLLPTLSNLFGLEFDSRLYMGRDVFSEASPLVMFRNRSWITDLASYNSATGEIINFTDTPVTDEYVQRIKNEVSNRFTVSTRILDYDYWRILFG